MKLKGLQTILFILILLPTVAFSDNLAASSQEFQSLQNLAEKDSAKPHGQLLQAKQRELTDQFLQAAEEEGAIMFTPPDGWGAVDPKSLGLSDVIKAMVMGKSKLGFPPSMNLMIHPYPKTIQEYVKEIKAENNAIKAEFKDLGTIRTQAGDGRLCQVDVPTQYGLVREMHVILKKGDQAVILTAGALKEEFPKFYKDFFASMRSLRQNISVVKNGAQKKQLTEKQSIAQNKHDIEAQTE